MANPTTRQTLIDYCLRQLGHPVVEINVDDDQVEDAIDQALQFYREFHYDAIERVYLQHTITASTLHLSTLNAANFGAGEIVTGSTSGAKATVVGYQAANILKIRDITGTYVTGENIVGGTSATIGTTASSGSLVTLGNYDNNYVELNDAVSGVIRTLPVNTMGSSGTDIFSLQYQLTQSDVFNLMSSSIIYYNQVQQHISLLDQLLIGEQPIRFNRHQNRLYIDTDWATKLLPDTKIIIECYRILDPATYVDVYNDLYLKRYATSLIKRQWGVNMKKFSGITMPGGVTLNGQVIYDEALAEIKDLEEMIRDTYEEPVGFIMG